MGDQFSVKKEQKVKQMNEEGSKGKGILVVVREYIESALVAFVVALIVIVFICQPFKIPSKSMVPTLRVGDRIFVNKFIYRMNDPECGDVVVFVFPKDSRKDYIKRVAGLPGDRISIRRGDIYINGEQLREPESMKNRYYYRRGFSETVVPQNCLFH